MTRIDLHVKVLDASVRERAKRRGLDGLVYAPHFTRLPDIERIASQYSTDTLRVFPGRELFTGPWWDRRHVLALGLTDPVPDFLPLSVTLTELARQNATVLVPHPTFFSVSLSAADVRTHRDRFHAIEVYNPKYLPTHTRGSRELATAVDLPPFGSSYAHLRSSVGQVWTEFSTPIEDLSDLESAIRNGRIDRVSRRVGTEHTRQRVLEFAHLGWENSWQKVNRTLLSDREPTHPANPIYPSRFRELASY